MTQKLTVFFSLIVFCLTALAVHSYAARKHDPSPEGFWLTENKRAVIRIEACSPPKGLYDYPDMCGSIHWIIDGGLVYDEKNPNQHLRGRPLCGLQILKDFERKNDTSWIDGKIYKADDGEFYTASLQLLPTGDLKVRGYVAMPLIGKSKIWTPVKFGEYKYCNAP